jgi:hypothetical protein
MHGSAARGYGIPVKDGSHSPEVHAKSGFRGCRQPHQDSGLTQDNGRCDKWRTDCGCYTGNMFEAAYETVIASFLLSPLWVPVACVFYAIWRERLSRKMIVAFALAECLSFGLSYFALRVVAYAA